ncbi:hypothetical protein ACFLZ7_01090 [Nanoarchaeota archaeon]
MENQSYEIELKSLLSKEQFDRLCSELPGQMKLTNQESLNTIKFVLPEGGDIRLRHSNKTFEMVHKDGSATNLSRKENTINLNGKDDITNLIKLFNNLNFKQDPSWITHKKEFQHSFNGFNYSICLQHIEKFAYLLEVEFMSKSNDPQKHEQNIREVIKNLGCEPISNQEFKEKIKKYIEDNKEKDL